MPQDEGSQEDQSEGDTTTDQISKRHLELGLVEQDVRQRSVLRMVPLVRLINEDGEDFPDDSPDHHADHSSSEKSADLVRRPGLTEVAIDDSHHDEQNPQPAHV
ncbi:hypothetical protein SAMN05444392_10155 [Seinonella peptonophila]|uniref:Uncharacterized protein n=1 Tax=Seinonella peptonophila TaxID=112248 RepID=A0A1M4SN27_9BACL|nr:hypothetical protein SAMN05444392_10155 [Seinonella peptonophila]